MDHLIHLYLDIMRQSDNKLETMGSRTAQPGRWLREEFLRRKKRNPLYSLRSFARQLEVSPGRLSEVLSEKRALSLGFFHKISEKLTLSPQEKREFALAIVKGNLATQSRKFLEELGDSEIEEQISDDQFNLIGDWYHFAILSMLNTFDFTPSTSFIAKRLGITSVEARDALERLKRLGLVEQDGKNLKRTRQKVRTISEISSEALRRSHRQSLNQAIDSLDTIPVDFRSVSSLTMAIDVSLIPLAKKLIEAFKQTIENTLETGKRSEVYNLNIQLVPVTKIRRSHAEK